MLERALNDEPIRLNFMHYYYCENLRITVATIKNNFCTTETPKRHIGNVKQVPITDREQLLEIRASIINIGP